MLASRSPASGATFRSRRPQLPELQDLYSGNYARVIAQAQAAAGPPSLDLDALLRDDPFLRAQLLGIEAPVTAGTAASDAAIRARLVKYGGLPEGPLVTDDIRTLFNNIVDPVTRQAIADATSGGISTLAQLAEAFRVARSTSIGKLGAMGAIRSGEFGYEAAKDERNRNIAQAQALIDVMNSINESRASVLGLQQTAVGQRNQAIKDAYDRFIANVKNNQIAAPTDNPPNTPSNPATDPGIQK